MKRILIYIFCFSIITQSMIGQFLLLNPSTGTLLPPSTITTLLPQRISDNTDPLLEVNNRKPHEDEQKQSSYFIRDLFVDHLFSPSNCPSESSHFNVANYDLHMGSFFNLFTIQEKINNYLVFYSDYYRIIQIGLPLQKLLYPFHNFY